MQAITLWIGNAGIVYFAQSLLANELVSALAPPNRTLSVQDFSHTVTGGSYNYSSISIDVSNDTLQNFKPVYQSVTQLRYLEPQPGRSRCGHEIPDLLALSFNPRRKSFGPSDADC